MYRGLDLFFQLRCRFQFDITPFDCRFVNTYDVLNVESFDLSLIETHLLAMKPDIG